MGIGPSAHSFDGNFRRSWNISSTKGYLKSINNGELPLDGENLKISESYNEYIMLSLRTSSGISIQKIERKFGNAYLKYLKKQIKKYIDSKLLYLDGDTIRITSDGKFLSDKMIFRFICKSSYKIK